MQHRCAFGLITLLVDLLFMNATVAQNIWFDPHSGRRGAPDFMDLFQPNAPWPKAASTVSTFEISDELTYKHDVSDAQLKQMFEDLRRRKMDLSVGFSPLIGGERAGLCGYHVEGYGLRNGFANEAKRLRSLGAGVRFFGMDEPLFFGHLFHRDGDYFGCHLSIRDVARDVAERFQQARAVFPEVRFGDVEPLMAFTEQTWLADLATWFDAYEDATGDKLAFFRLDLGWDWPWQQRIPPLARLLTEKGIPLQIIYNGDDRATSDEAWIASAVSHFKQYESGGRTAPDAAVFQYWQDHPSTVLPEADSRTATWLINAYADWHKRRGN